LFVRPLSCHDQFAGEVEARFEFGIAGKRGLTRRTRVRLTNAGAWHRNFACRLGGVRLRTGQDNAKSSETARDRTSD
jgi:hypothetical protein